MRTIPDIIAKHVEACVAELRDHVQQEFRAALGGGIVAAPPETPEFRAALGGGIVAAPPETPAGKRSRPAVPRKPKRIGQRDFKPAKAAPAPKQRGARACGCGPVGRHRRECKLATGTGPRAAKKPASDDEDSGAGRDADPVRDPGPDRVAPTEVDLVVAERAVRYARELEAAKELPVIPHARLVAMLAADRANNAVGDAGGFVARDDRGPSLVGHAETKREHCPVHGWVGRVAFERDGHGHCRAERPAGAVDCPACDATGWGGVGVCARCDGHTFLVEVEEQPIDNSERIKAATSTCGVVEMVGLDGERIRERIQRRRDVRGHERAETTSVKQLTRAEIKAGWLEIEAMDRHVPGFVDPPRPKTRGECGEQRPCPWVSCRHHLALDVNPETGSIKIVFPDVEPWELEHSCALDAAELGAHTLEALAEKLNITRERARQVEAKSLAALRAGLVQQRVVSRGDIAEGDAA